MKTESTPLFESMVDALNDLFGVHPGSRAAHAKGTVCTGTFVGSVEARALSRAAHLQGGEVAVTARFSNGSGNPTAADETPDGRGLAVKFHLPDGSITDMVSISIPVFPVRTAEEFIAFTRARKPDPLTGKPDPAVLGPFLAAHPHTARALALLGAAPPVTSYADGTYNGIHTFRHTSSGGVATNLRYSFQPVSAATGAPAPRPAPRSRDFMQDELRARLTAAPVSFDLYFVPALPGDDLTDPTTPWPADRPRVLAGRLTLTAASPSLTGREDAMIFDPTNVTDGVECSADEILHARAGAYSVSYARRMA